LARPLRDVGDAVLNEVDSFYATGGSPTTLLSLWPTPDLTARGWWLMGHPAFVARGPAPHATPARPGVEVRVAGDASELAVAERIAVEGYPLPQVAGRAEPNVLPPGLLDTGLRVRVGRIDGQPAAVGNSYTGHGVVNLCLGATLPAARRRGVWEALVWARVDDAPDLPAVAYTSDYSRPGFIRMGFLPITRFTLWARSPAS
ncbi:MAG: GNAT family N-acetyltransferase, partial [Acidimicrobiia bacterium]